MTALGFILEEWGAQFDGSGGGVWAPLQSPAGTADTAFTSQKLTRGGTFPPHLGGEWTVVPEEATSPHGPPQSTNTRHFNNFIQKALPVRDPDTPQASGKNIIAASSGFGPHLAGSAAPRTIPLATAGQTPCLVSP